MQDFDGLAEVWLPESPGHHVTAVVSFDADRGCSARMLGGPAPTSPPDGSPRAATAVTLNLQEFLALVPAGQPKRIPVLRGMASGRPFAMLDCVMNLVTRSATGLPEVEVSSELALLDLPDGCWDLDFDRLVLSTPWLIELSNTRGLTCRWTTGQDSGGMRIEVVAQPVAAVEGTVEHEDGPVSVRLTVGHSQESSMRPRQVTVVEDATLELVFPRPVPLARLREKWVTAVEDLLSLAIGRRNIADEVWVSRSDAAAGAPDADAPAVRLLARRRLSPAPVDQEPLSVGSEVRTGSVPLGELLSRWLPLLESDGPTIRLLLSASDRGDAISLRLHVVTMAVAAEWWHSTRLGQHYVDSAVLADRVERIVQSLDKTLIGETDIKWIRERLLQNNKGNRDRLLDIAGSVVDLTRDLVGDPGALEHGDPGLAAKWAKWVNEVRNSGGAHAGGGADYLAAYWAAESLRWVLMAAVLTELGVGDVALRLQSDASYRTCRDFVRARLG